MIQLGNGEFEVCLSFICTKVEELHCSKDCTKHIEFVCLMESQKHLCDICRLHIKPIDCETNDI